jgi:hypothetical protein
MDKEILELLAEHRKYLENHKECLKDIDMTLTTLMASISALVCLLVNQEVITQEEFNELLLKEEKRFKENQGFNRDLRNFLRDK